MKNAGYFSHRFRPFFLGLWVATLFVCGVRGTAQGAETASRTSKETRQNAASSVPKQGSAAAADQVRVNAPTAKASDPSPKAAPANAAEGKAAPAKAADGKAAPAKTAEGKAAPAKAADAKTAKVRAAAAAAEAAKAAEVAKAEQAAKAAEAAKKRAAELASQREAAAAKLRQLGSMSVGLPNTGFLVNGARMPPGDDWIITVPSHGFATEETVRQLGHCISATRAEFADSPRVMLGSLSAERGGKLPPHKSHRTGRDADVYFFRKPGASWNKAATEQDIDLPRTWALLRCFVTEADVDMVLIDQKVQGWLERYALSIGEPPEWVQELFHDKPHTKSALVRHVPGHVAHMHVRFVSARARRLGAQHYRELVNAGMIQERVEEVRHTVVKGDTLLGLAKRFQVSVDEIRALNGLTNTVIRLGQQLVVAQGKPIEGVEAPVFGPGRALPPQPCEPGPKACHAGLALINRPMFGAIVGEAPQDETMISASLR